MTSNKAFNSELEMNVNSIQLHKSLHGKTASLALDGSGIVFTRDFSEKYPNLSNIDPKQLYDKVLKDISVLPRITQLESSLENIYETNFKLNLNALYNNAPASFSKLVSNSALYEYYQLRFYLFVMIDYINEHESELQSLTDISKYISWIRPRNDQNIKYFISGPKENSTVNIDNVVEHYRSLIDPNTTVQDLTSYLQLSTQQTLSSISQQTLEFMQTAPNVYTKNPNEQCKYLLSIDSSKDVLVTIDNNNNLVFDCSNLQIGDLSDKTTSARLNEIKLETAPRAEISTLAIRSIRDLFNHYGRLKIISLKFTDDAFISSLDVFTKVFIIFAGVSCDERALYNTTAAPYLKIGGVFKKVSNGYEFVADADAITYKPARVDVKQFKIYITTNPDSTNSIIPNAYSLKVDKTKMFQHPYKTNLQASPNNTARVVDYTYQDLVSNSNSDTSITTHLETDNTQQLIEDFTLILEAQSTDIDNILSSTYTLKQLKQVPEYLVILYNAFVDLSGKLPDVYATYYMKQAITARINKLRECVYNMITKMSNKDLRNTITIDEHNRFTRLLTGFTKQNLLKLCKMIVLNLSSCYNMKYIEKYSLNNAFDMSTLVSPTREIVPYADLDTAIYSTLGLEPYNAAVSTILNKSYATAAELYANVQLLMRAIPFTEDSTFTTFYNYVKAYLQVNSMLQNMFLYNTANYTLQDLTEEKIVKIDVSNGMINGKYFRMINGRPQFIDQTTGKEYTTADPNYLQYTTDENDLMIINKYKYTGNSTIENIENGSYMYSSNENTIQRLPYILEDYSKIFNTIRFVNTYTLADKTDPSINYSIVPDYMQASRSSKTVHWSFLQKLYTQNVYKYIKTVTQLQDANSTITTSYYIIDLKNNTILTDVHESDAVAVYDIENEYWHDVFGTSSNTNAITIKQLFSTNWTNVSNETYVTVPKVLDSFTTHITEENSETHETINGLTTTTVIILDELYDMKLYYKYNSFINQLTHEDTYNELIAIYNTITPYTYNNNQLILNDTHVSIQFPIPVSTYAISYFETDSVKYFDSLPISSFIKNDSISMYNDDVYFTGYARKVSIQHIELNGIITETRYGNKYIASIIGAVSTSSTIKNTLTQFESNNYQVHTTSVCDKNSIIYNDYFGNTLSIVDGQLVSSIASTLADINNKTYNMIDSSSNTVSVTYTINTYTTCSEIIVTTVINNITTATTTTMTTYIDYNSAGNVVISMSSSNDSNIVLANTIAVSFENAYYDKSLMYYSNTFSNNIINSASNMFKAFGIIGYNIVSKYWNDNSYEYSLAHTVYPINAELVNVPIMFNESYTCDDNTDVYTYNDKDGIELLSGTYTITANAIKYSEDASNVNSLYVYKHKQNNYTYEPTEDNETFMTQRISLELIDDDYNKYMKLNIIFDQAMTQAVRVELIVNHKYYITKQTAIGYYYTQDLCIGSYDDKIVSGIPFYVNTINGTYICIINYSIEEGVVTFNDINILESINEIIYYKTTSTGVKQCILPHIYANNTVTNSNITNMSYNNLVLNMTMNSKQYRYHPVFAYAENAFESPCYINTSDNLITMLEAFNQNTKVINAQVKAENTLSEDISYNVADYIPTNQSHVIESLDNNFLMISDFDKRNELSKIAVKTNYIHVIPTTTRMTLSIEFS